MQNTDWPHCSEPAETKRITSCGTEIEISNTGCSADGITYPVLEGRSKVWTVIVPRSRCDAKCPFCIAGASIRNDESIDIRKLEKALVKLKEADIVSGVTITGGEPCGDMALLNETICAVYDILGRDTFVQLDTNGTHLMRLRELKYVERLSEIHISRHHYDDAVNRSIFGYDVPTAETIRDVIASFPDCEDLFVFNCMLLRGYIDSTDAVHRYLDHAAEIGAFKASFISGTPVNPYAAARIVEFTDLLKDDDDSLLFTRRFFDHGYCHCRDGVYVTPGGKVIEFYGRGSDPRASTCVRRLVYQSDNTLRAGYGGKILWQEEAL